MQPWQEFEKKLLTLLEKKREKVLSARKDLVWFNLGTDGKSTVIQEFTELFNIRYRTASSSMPGQYSFETIPTILVIDRTGIVKMIYSGYSPTFIEDILASVKGK